MWLHTTVFPGVLALNSFVSVLFSRQQNVTRARSPAVAGTAAALALVSSAGGGYTE